MKKISWLFPKFYVKLQQYKRFINQIEIRMTSNYDTTKLIIKYNYSKPIELVELTLSLLDLGNLYNRFMNISGYEINKDYSSLVLKEAKSGSLIFELVENLTPIIPLLSDFNNIIQFCNYLKLSYSYFAGEISAKKPNNSIKDLEKLNGIINPVAKDNSSSVNFIAQEGSKQIFNLYLNSKDSNAIQNKIKKEIDEQEQSDEKIYRKQLLTWNQVKFEEKSQTGNRAIIENIYKTPVKVIFDNDDLKVEMTTNNNKFEKDWQYLAYHVDVQVQTIKDKPKVFKILQYYPEETFDPEEF